MKKTPTVLCILDGFGLNPDVEANAVLQANTQNFNRIWNEFPHQVLITHGERVGLPAGQMGNSEVGHLNIGAGRVVEQWLTRISRLLREDALPTLPAYKKFIADNKSRDVHIVGLVSNGGIHSHIDHLIMVVKRLRMDIPGRIIIHAITDGRDTPPQSGLEFLTTLTNAVGNLKDVFIATITGRLFAMDRDTRWERTEKFYSVVTKGIGTKATDLKSAVNAAYQTKSTDEFLEPISLGDFTITSDDAILFFNFREDRARQTVAALTQTNFDHFTRDVVIPASQVLCFTEYDQTFNLPVLFEPQTLSMHLGETISLAGKSQARIAETEKYPHVTYFMNGKTEEPYPLESRMLVPSDRTVKTYDLKPEMSAKGIMEKSVAAITSGEFDLVVINFANCDMVGHSGILDAAIKAVETVDTCLGEVVAAVESVSGQMVVIADHGNAEQMLNYESRQPHTSHTTHVVPVVVLQFGEHELRVAAVKDDGSLCDVAPTLLALMGMKQPELMTGRSLLI